MKVTVVEYFVLQGSSINREMVKVSKRARKNPNILKKPLNTIAYRFFESKMNFGKESNNFENKENVSKITFMKKFYTLKELKSLLAEFKKILPNMKKNNWKEAIRLESGKWQEFRLEDCSFTDTSCVYGTYAFTYNEKKPIGIRSIFNNDKGFEVLAQIFTIDEIEKLIPTYETMISKMERDGFGSTVEVGKHNWKYLKTDKLI